MDFAKDLILVLTGGLCAMAGGFLSAWVQSSRARKVRFEEKMGEKKVEVYQKALEYADDIKSLLMEGTEDDVLNYIRERTDWFFGHIIFFPEKFENNWRSIVLNLKALKRRKDGSGEHLDQIEKIEKLLDELAEEMDLIIRRELKLKPVKIQRPIK